MKFRLGFISNSSSTTYIIRFPTRLSEDKVKKAEFILENPPEETLHEILPYKYWNVEECKELLKELTIISKDETETIYETNLYYKITETYGGYRTAAMTFSNEDEDIISMLVYFCGLDILTLHPSVKIEGSFQM